MAYRIDLWLARGIYDMQVGFAAGKRDLWLARGIDHWQEGFMACKRDLQLVKGAYDLKRNLRLSYPPILRLLLRPCLKSKVR